MRLTVVFFAGAAALLSAGSAGAQELPRWNLERICAAEASAREYCVAFERQAYSELSGVWPSLQRTIRETCLEQVAAFGQNSYRLLSDCIEDMLTAQRVDYVRRASGVDAPDPPAQTAVEPVTEAPAAEAPAVEVPAATAASSEPAADGTTPEAASPDAAAPDAAAPAAGAPPADPADAPASPPPSGQSGQ